MRKLQVALAVSLILNLFLAGALFAGVVSVRSGVRMINAGSLRVAGAELPMAERRPFRMALREARAAMRPTIVQALDRARIADMAVRAAVERRAVAFAATLPPADRVKLADAVQRRADKASRAAP